MILRHDLTSDIYHSYRGFVYTNINTYDTGFDLIYTFNSFHIFHISRII